MAVENWNVWRLWSRRQSVWGTTSNNFNWLKFLILTSRFQWQSANLKHFDYFFSNKIGIVIAKKKFRMQKSYNKIFAFWTNSKHFNCFFYEMFISSYFIFDNFLRLTSIWILASAKRSANFKLARSLNNFSKLNNLKTHFKYFHQ